MSLDQGVRSIDYIASLVMVERMEENDRNYQRFVQLAINCYLYELKLSISPTIKTVTLTVANNGTIEFPDDYINYTAIGVCLNGKIWTLTRNDKLCLDRSEDCPVELSAAIEMSSNLDDQQVSYIIPYGYSFNTGFRNGQYVGEQFSYGGGWNKKGYYRIDEQMRRIAFSQVAPGTEIILEYNATNIACDGTMSVPFQAVAAIKAYTHWQAIEHDPKYSLSDRESKRREYVRQFNILKHYNLMFTVSEYLDAKYRSIKSTVKR